MGGVPVGFFLEAPPTSLCDWLRLDRQRHFGDSIGSLLRHGIALYLLLDTKTVFHGGGVISEAGI